MRTLWRSPALRRGAVGAGLALALLAVAAHQARAEDAWVRDEVRLNLRTGRGTQYRIQGLVKTGDRVTILERSESWTRVRTEDGTEGWIPAGFLQSEPPAEVRVGRLDAEVEELSAELERLREENAELQSEARELRQRDAEQRETIERLTVENRDLRAGQRWPYLLTGAGILGGGLLLGAILQSLTSRRQTRRIKL